MAVKTLFLFIFLAATTVVNGQQAQLYLHDWSNGKVVRIPKKYDDISITYTVATDTGKISQRIITASGKIIRVDSTSLTLNLTNESFSFTNANGVKTQNDITYDGYSDSTIITETRIISLKDITAINASWTHPVAGVGAVLSLLSSLSALVVAPLASINYSTGDINSHKYYAILLGSATGLALGTPLISIFQKNKEYMITPSKSKNNRTKTFYLSNH